MGSGRRADQGVNEAAAFGSEWSAGLRRGSDGELRRWLEVAQAACDEADVTARAHFRRDLVIETKPDRSFVTQADTAIEQRIRERLLDAFPDHGLVGEEYGTEAGDASVAGTSTRSTGPTTSSAACRCSGRCSQSSGTASSRRA